MPQTRPLNKNGIFPLRCKTPTEPKGGVSNRMSRDFIEIGFDWSVSKWYWHLIWQWKNLDAIWLVIIKAKPVNYINQSFSRNFTEVKVTDPAIGILVGSRFVSGFWLAWPLFAENLSHSDWLKARLWRTQRWCFSKGLHPFNPNPNPKP